MKKVLKYSLRTLLYLLVFLLVLPLAIYIPAVQRWGKNEIIDYVYNATGMQLQIESLSIGFPFKLQLNDVLALTAQQDTMFQSRQAQVSVAPLALLTGDVDVPKIALKDSYLNFTTADSTLQISANVHILSTRKANIDLRKNLVELPDTRIDGADITLNILKLKPDTVPPDTVPLDWRIHAKKLKLFNVHYSMTAPSIRELDVDIPEATLRQGRVDLFTQSVEVNEATITQGAYRYIPELAENIPPQEVGPFDSIPTPPWTVQIQQLRLVQNRALYAQPNYTPQKGLDVSYLSLNLIDLSIDSLYNRGSEIRVPVKELSFAERSGLIVTHTEGTFLMDSTSIALQQFSMKTPYSRLTIDANTHPQIFEQSPHTPVQARLSARLGVRDINALFPDYSTYTQGLTPSTQLKSELSVSGELRDLHLRKGTLELPGTLTAQLNGRVQNMTQPKEIVGNLQWDCTVTNSPLVTHLLNDSTHRIHIPDTRFTGEASIDKDTIQAKSHIEAHQGNIALHARYNLSRQRYRGQINIDRFPLDAYLPHDSLGILSASAKFSGRGFSPTDTTTRARIDLAIDSLDYSGHRYTGLALKANLRKGNLSGNIVGTDAHANMALALKGRLLPGQYSAHISGNLHTNLKALNLSTETCSVSTDIDLHGSAAPTASDYSVNLELNNFSAQLPEGNFKTNLFTLSAETDSTHMQAQVRNGDLAIDFNSTLGLDNFLSKIEQTIPLLDSASQKRRLDITQLHQVLPSFELSTTAKRNNLLHQYLKGMDIAFTQLNLQLQNDSMLNITGAVDRLSTAGITVDTIRLGAYERREHEDRLYYTLHIGNRPGNLDQLASVDLNGFLSGNSTRLFCIQKNRQGQMGFRIGCQADFLDEQLQFSFFPKNPIIGFETWTLNEDNFLTYHYNKHFDADISLTHDDKHLIIETQHEHEGHDLAHQEALLIDIKGMEIAPWLTLSPFAPQIAGSLSAYLEMGFPEQGIEVDGDLGIHNFYYGKQRVGDFDLNVDYQLDSLDRHLAQAALMIDSTRVMTLSGKLDNQAENPTDLNLSLNQFPLKLANPFLPPNTLQLQGAINGDIELSGSLSEPQLNGEIRFNNATANSKSLGAILNFSQEPLRISNNILRLNNYTLTGANTNSLRINGVVDFRKLDNITTDLTLQAREFQPVKSKKSSKATLYGSAVTDIDMSVKGPLDALKIRGDIDLITGTELTYVMQDSPFALQQQENNLVTFVSFNDSTNIVEADTIPSRSLSGMDMLVNINIAPTVKIAVNLSVDGKNRIDLQGGGQLTYTMNPLGDSRFTGQYNINGGFVRYSPPIISEKLFVIQEGSRVTWSGEMTNPYLSITGVETMRTSITEDNKNTRQVDFDISIIIKNTLENLSVAFDLAAPDDLTLQNQLSSLTAEQRSSQAMSLLIYNTYTGPGTSTKNDLLGNPLNAFLQKELNQWAQENLKGIDLSFGINSYTDASGVNTRTDYSYKASKSLWNNRVKVAIGGSLSPDDDADVNFKENFIDDISLEYYFNQRDNMYIKVFRQTDYEILEGEITQMGVGFVLKKRLVRLSDLFHLRKSKEKIEKVEEVRQEEIESIENKDEETEKEVTP